MGFWQRFLQKSAQSNRQSFGTGKLDCCDLNRAKESKPQAQPTKQQQ